MPRILVTGALGQIGSELTRELRRRHGDENVLATDARPAPAESPLSCETLDVTDRRAVEEVMRRHRAEMVYHLAAVLSATGERNPGRAWQVNMDGLRNVLDACRDQGVRRLFCPSTIGVFGPDAPRDATPQDAATRPTTMYGVTKVAGELLCDYYFRRDGLDVRGVRYPGVISCETPPGGGTTDYAVEMFHAAVRTGRYTCFVSEPTVLPLIYMPDCLKAALDLMDADLSQLNYHSSYNLQSMSFSAGELAAEIRRHLPEFVCEFVPDERQAIADTWPRSIDDTPARRDWDWRAEYDLPTMTADMLRRLSKQ